MVIDKPLKNYIDEYKLDINHFMFHLIWLQGKN
jgi:hypothetical protein